MNWTQNVFWNFNYSCKYGQENDTSKGPQFDLVTLTNNTLFCQKDPQNRSADLGCRNITGIGYSWNYSATTTYSGTVWSQGSKRNCGSGPGLEIYQHGLKMTKASCRLPHGWWWLCGDGYARKILPKEWYGVCTAGHLNTQDTLHNHSQIPRGFVRSLLLKVQKRTSNPLIEQPSGFHSFVWWLFPMLGVSELEKTIVNISATLDEIFNTSTNAIANMQVEIASLSLVVVQNRMALDILTAEAGGVCTVINQSCCSYVNREGQIEKDLHKIWEKTRIFHEIIKDNMEWGFTDLWDKLTSWLPNFGWLKQLFIGLITLAILGIFVCVLFKCFLWCCQN
ncbi:endogenous retrovirus group V member 2 Env polyprotein-like [Aquila chrysaetos chrysaetos]|uniref:endogenous retrovirus group V member 2 Env polyprotein-like n=1 Tax=Aquila chrysaetos chrysaetos TaxID=223781 RepID=UPI001B7D3EDB|nr:endogenous retrovirus group V member 2 Env polyprotein-like [Aquila chrysaetos chrysaetos]